VHAPRDELGEQQQGDGQREGNGREAARDGLAPGVWVAL